MSGKRIVELCDHGVVEHDDKHAWPGSWCEGGRSLIEGQYVLIEKVDDQWPEWATKELAVFTAWGDDIDLDHILDALSDHTEGTP